MLVYRGNIFVRRLYELDSWTSLGKRSSTNNRVGLEEQFLTNGIVSVHKKVSSTTLQKDVSKLVLMKLTCVGLCGPLMDALNQTSS